MNMHHELGSCNSFMHICKCNWFLLKIKSIFQCAFDKVYFKKFKSGFPTYKYSSWFEYWDWLSRTLRGSQLPDEQGQVSYQIIRPRRNSFRKQVSMRSRQSCNKFLRGFWRSALKRVYYRHKVWRMEATFQSHLLDTTIYQTKYRS